MRVSGCNPRCSSWKKICHTTRNNIHRSNKLQESTGWLRYLIWINFCYFLSTEWKCFLKSRRQHKKIHVYLCLSYFPLPRHWYCAWYGLYEVANVGQYFCFHQLGGTALASFRSLFLSWPQGSCTSPSKLFSLSKCSEHPQSTFI